MSFWTKCILFSFFESLLVFKYNNDNNKLRSYEFNYSDNTKNMRLRTKTFQLLFFIEPFFVAILI